MNKIEILKNIDNYINTGDLEKAKENIKEYIKAFGYDVNISKNESAINILNDRYNEAEVCVQAEYYQQINEKKFICLFRRIEFNIEFEKSLEVLIGDIKNKIIDENHIIKIVNNNLINKTYVLNIIAVKCMENNLFHVVKAILYFAYALSPGDLETNYNIAHFFKLTGESKIIHEKLMNLKDRNHEFKTLKQMLEGGISNKIAFIICFNDDTLYNECVTYINNLAIPKGYEVSIIPVKDADSITSGYNSAMKSSDAKYKVYLHQDTFIINNNFIYDILNIFIPNEKVGIIGVIGSKVLPENAIWWEADEKYGEVYESHTGKLELLAFNKPKKQYVNVMAIDGLIMITQYDRPWREDIFNGWHFYDISQCMEFILVGYKVVVANQKNNTWCLHDCGRGISDDYEKFRLKFLEEYSKDILN